MSVCKCSTSQETTIKLYEIYWSHHLPASFIDDGPDYLPSGVLNMLFSHPTSFSLSWKFAILFCHRMFWCICWNIPNNNVHGRYENWVIELSPALHWSLQSFLPGHSNIEQIQIVLGWWWGKHTVLLDKIGIKERKGKEEYRKTVKVEFKRKWGLLCLTRALWTYDIVSTFVACCWLGLLQVCCVRTMCFCSFLHKRQMFEQ